ncbi:peripheral-type benzodiazepine receptor [Paraphysoderma sedebokerense]|nr:peripheral-type benzodiazepine receptor [Paraphysoderma sedebokerense]
MGIASHRIYQLPPPVRQPALTVYAVSLGLNALWSPLFFSAKRIGLALVDIVGLWGTVGASTVMFYQRDRVAGALMVPYIAWVSLATALNFWIWRNNDQKKVNKKK